MENDVSNVSEHVVQPGYTLWTVGYILRLDAAKELLSTQAEQHMWLGEIAWLSISFLVSP